MITAFIPARGGSKGIKDKNITLICGKPMIYWVLNALKDVESIGKIVVATDSSKIKDTVLSFGFDKTEIYDREPDNAQDTSKTVDVILEYIEKTKPDGDFLLVQATSPLLQKDDVIGFLKNYENCDSSFSCVEFNRICWTKDGKPLEHDLKNRKRRQDGSNIVVENGAMYINSVENIKKEKALLTGNIKPYLMPFETIHEIDEPKDIEVVEKIMKQKYKPDINNFKMFLTDCDGVLTDAGMYYNDNGEVLKKFSANDGLGINELRKLGIYVAIITGESSDFAKARAKKLNIDCYCGVNDKLSKVKVIAKNKNVDLSQIIYIGDDLNDLDVIKSVGFSACPANAQAIIKENVNYETKLSGGNGAVRELINYLL